MACGSVYKDHDRQTPTRLACRLKQALSKAVNSFLEELDNYTLADLVEENQPLYKLLLVE